MAPTSRMAEASLGKIPTTRDRLLISLLLRSRGLVDQIFCQWALGNAANARTSARAVSMSGPALGKLAVELVSYLVPGAGHGVGVGLSEDGAEQGGDHVLVAAGHRRQKVPDEMHPASLSGRALEPAVGGSCEPSVRVGDHQAHIAAWIDTWYNPLRLHSANNMTSPNDHENAQAA